MKFFFNVTIIEIFRSEGDTQILYLFTSLFHSLGKQSIADIVGHAKSG